MKQTTRSPSRRQKVFLKTISASLLLVLLCFGWNASHYNIRLSTVTMDAREMSILKTNVKPDVIAVDSNEGSRNHSLHHNRNSSNNTAKVVRPEEKQEMPPFWPIKTFRLYQEQHSDTALLAEDAFALGTRKFAVAYYWCPHRAGNILHSFLNTMVWAVIHNRTVLWKYDTTAPDTNTETDCQAILQRASWIPSYDEWSERLHLEEPVPVPMDKNRWAYDQEHATVIYPQIADLQWNRTDITRHTWSDHPIERKDFRQYLHQLPEIMKRTMAQLYHENADFLYGMLYRECFTLQVPLLSSIQQQQQHHNVIVQDDSFESDVLSVALHSRHTVAADDGSFIGDELQCLNKLLSLPSHNNNRTSNNNCRVHLMSDRPRTIALLTNWLVDRNCSVVTATRDTGTSLSKEHGPWAGIGFLQDLEMAAAARHGAIGDPHRSSFALLVKLMEYDRKVAAWKRDTVSQQQDANDELLQCKLPARKVSGYDYGPGTPTFRHHSFLKPLEPVRVLEDYILQHSEESQEPTNRRFVVASLDCALSVTDRIYSVMNSLVYAMLHNRTLLWKTGDDCDGQDRVLRVKSWIPIYSNVSWHVSSENLVQVQLDSNSFALHANDTVRDAQVVTVRSAYRHGIETFVSTHGSRTTAERLYTQGIDFLYGMLFHRIFTLKNLSSIDTINKTWADPSTISVAVHSGNDNTNSESSLIRQIQCLESVLPDIDRPCSVLMLSNRSSTLTGLQKWLKGRNCSAVTLTTEPASERNFFQRVSLASKARSGYIGHASVASSLVLEWIEYGRRMETWKLGRDPFFISDLPKCTLAETILERSAARV